jgi:hypothetical protein
MRKFWTKQIPLGRLLIITITSLFLIGCSQTTPTNNTPAITQISDSTINENQEYSQFQSKIAADKIEIILFHATNRCYSCNKMEELVQKTLEENFEKELDNKKISFQEINWELPENKEIVEKYKAWGLSLFINWVTNGQENIEQETTAWRLISNESAFKEYMKNKINTLL